MCFKAGVDSGVPVRTKNQLTKKAISHRRTLQKKPKGVKKYFEHHKIAYTAWLHNFIAGFLPESCTNYLLRLEALCL